MTMGLKLYSLEVNQGGREGLSTLPLPLNPWPNHFPGTLSSTFLNFFTILFH